MAGLLKIASNDPAMIRMIGIAGAFWVAAPLLFLFVYTPILWRPRIGEK